MGVVPNDFSISLACNNTMAESQPFPRITSVAERWSRAIRQVWEQMSFQDQGKSKMFVSIPNHVN
jgi:hypothetical protein